MSDDVNEPNGDEEPTRGASIFDMFEPPPEIDPNRFGPIPVVPGVGGEPPADDRTIDPAATDDAPADGGPSGRSEPAGGAGTISEIFGFDPVESGAVPETAPSEAGSTGTELPHWTEPATGVVPKVIGGDGESDGRPEVGGPRWHGEGPQWAGDDFDAVFADEEGVGGPRRITIDDDAAPVDIPSAAGAPQRQQPVAAGPAHRPQVAASGERDITQAIVFGLLIAGLAAAAFYAGQITTMILISVIAVLGAGELYEAMRKQGLHPATLLGMTASVALPVAVYNRGDAGFTLVIGMSVVFGALWYLVGADTHRPALNLGLTMLGISWVGGMAGFAALLVRADQIEVLLAAVIITVASDTGAYAGGKALGSRPFHPASPNKTWEGTIVGFIAAVVAGVIIWLLEISVFADTLPQAVLLGAVVGVIGPIGDLTESMVKRDLNTKDMGHLIPGHGGVLDRLDALLFAIPAAYYLGRVLDLF